MALQGRWVSFSAFVFELRRYGDIETQDIRCLRGGIVRTDELKELVEGLRDFEGDEGISEKRMGGSRRELRARSYQWPSI